MAGNSKTKRSKSRSQEGRQKKEDRLLPCYISRSLQPPPQEKEKPNKGRRYRRASLPSFISSSIYSTKSPSSAYQISVLFLLLLGSNDGQVHVVEDLDGVDVKQTLLRRHEAEVDGVRERPHGPRSHDTLDQVILDLGHELARRLARGDA